MSYNSVLRPKFYVNSLESLYNKGFVDTIHPTFLSSSWHSPKSYAQDTTISFNLTKQNLLSDISHIMILGHKDISFTIEGVEIEVISNLSASEDEDTGEDSYSATHNYVPIIMSASGFTGDSISFNFTGDYYQLSGICICSSYQLPYNPDLGVEKKIEYSGETYYSDSGISHSLDFGSSKRFNPFINIYSNVNQQTLYVDGDTIDDYPYESISSGRRTYDISYSYIGSNPNGQSHLMPRDFNYRQDVLNLNDEFNTNDTDKYNLYTSVINKTMGTHIPFIFSIDGSNYNDLILARFKDNNLSLSEVAPNVHNVSFGIREVW